MIHHCPGLLSLSSLFGIFVFASELLPLLETLIGSVTTSRHLKILRVSLHGLSLGTGLKNTLSVDKLISLWCLQRLPMGICSVFTFMFQCRPFDHNHKPPEVTSFAEMSQKTHHPLISIKKRTVRNIERSTEQTNPY